jgi:hypothetical protein
MKTKILYLLNVLFFALVSSSCKKADVEMSQAFIKYYGGIEKDFAADMAVTPDGGYVILGTTKTEGTGGSDLLVIRTDAYGNELWHKTFGGDHDDYAGGIEVTPDGGYIVVGTLSHKANVFDPRNDSTSMYALRLNSNGGLIKDTVFNYKGTFSNPGEIYIGTQGVDVQNIPGGGFIFAGVLDTARIFDLYAVMANDNLSSRLDSSDFLYGTAPEDDIPGRIAVTTAGEFVLTSSTKLNGNYTPRIVQFLLNSNYLVQYQAPENTVFGDPTLGYASDIIQTGNNNFAIVGSTFTLTAGTPNPQDIYFMRLDNNLNVVGSIVKYGEASSKEKGVSISKTSDGGYIILGTTDNEEYIGAPEKKNDLLIIKVNANGVEEWKKTFGGVGDDVAISIKQTTDNGYVICGTIDFGNNNDNSDKSNAVVLLKLNEDGELSNTK